MIVVLNLKMHMSLRDIINYEKLIHNYEVIVLPQFPYMPFFHNGKYSLGSQDVSKYKSGNYTGEVCAKALKDLNTKYVLVGHSERKQFFNETMNDVGKKIENIMENEMIPIICVNDREKDSRFKGIENQIQYISPYIKYAIIAYEPEWLIGSDQDIDIDYLKRAVYKIKECLLENKINHSLIYGGNVNKNNIESIIGVPGIDGIIMSSSARDLNELGYILKTYK